MLGGLQVKIDHRHRLNHALESADQAVPAHPDKPESDLEDDDRRQHELPRPDGAKPGRHGPFFAQRSAIPLIRQQAVSRYQLAYGGNQ